MRLTKPGPSRWRALLVLTAALTASAFAAPAAIAGPPVNDNSASISKKKCGKKGGGKYRASISKKCGKKGGQKGGKGGSYK